MRLKIWWIPQVPMNSFQVEVKSLEEASLLLDVLAEYDKFQFENNVKPDYSNAGGLMMFDEHEQEWFDWEDEQTGEDFDQWRAQNLPQTKILAE